MYAFGVFFSESWVGPIFSQFSYLLPSHAVGFAVALFVLFGTISGTVINLIIGEIINKNGQTAISNQIVTWVGISYIGCAIPFFIGMLMYRKLLMNRAPTTSVN